MKPRALLPVVTRRSACGAACIALALGVFASEARAHIVPVGVGCSTWIDVTPRKVRIRYNVGFSNLLAVGEFKKADRNGDHRIDAEEEDAYLSALGPKLVAKLRVLLDGKPLPLAIVGHSTDRMRGEIGAVAIAFETYFDLEAPIEPGTSPHLLSFRDGNYEGEDGQQLQFVVDARMMDFFQELSVEQPEKRPPPINYPLSPMPFEGREVAVSFTFSKDGLERARAEEMLEPSLRGIEKALDGIAGNVARGAERDLSGMGAGEVSFRPTPFHAARSPYLGPASMASANVPSRPSDPESEEADTLQKELAKPFTLGSVLFFLVAGALHAKGPGHGKTMVAAYILGTRGRLWDAVRLGAIVTFTHTFTLYTFGLGIVYGVQRLVAADASQRVQNRAIFLVSLGSGIFLTLYGLMLAWRRNEALKRSDAALAEKQAPPAKLPETLAAPSTGKRLSLVAPAKVEAPGPGAHTHTHADGTKHTHVHDGAAHSHGHSRGAGHAHSHEDMDEAEHAALHAREAQGEVSSFRDLLALGLSSGITPCPAGILIIVFSLTFHADNTLRCFIYLNAFSLGLGAILIAIAAAMVFSRRYLLNALTEKRQRWLKVIPVYSALAIAVIGLFASYEAFDPNFKKAYAKVTSAVSSENRRGP